MQQKYQAPSLPLDEVIEVCCPVGMALHNTVDGSFVLAVDLEFVVNFSVPLDLLKLMNKNKTPLAS